MSQPAGPGDTQAVVRDVTESGLARLAGALAVLTPSAGLLQTLASLRDYRQPAVAIAVWIVLLGAAGWLLPRTRLDGLARGEAAGAALIAVAAVAALGWEHRPQPGSGGIDLAILGSCWLLALLALSQPAWAWIGTAAVMFSVHAVLVVAVAGPGPDSLSQLEASGYILVAIMTAFAALRPTLAAHARVSARRAVLASRADAERAAADAVRTERRNRLARLELEALPLVRGIADGLLDPADPAVRERCARHAAALRHSLAGPGPAAGGPLAALEPALRAAAARGLLVNVQVIGDPVLPHDVAATTLAPVREALGALPPQRAMLTVVATADGGELYLTFSEPQPDGVEISWRGGAR